MLNVFKLPDLLIYAFALNVSLSGVYIPSSAFFDMIYAKMKSVFEMFSVGSFDVKRCIKQFLIASRRC